MGVRNEIHNPIEAKENEMENEKYEVEGKAGFTEEEALRMAEEAEAAGRELEILDAGGEEMAAVHLVRRAGAEVRNGQGAAARSPLPPLRRRPPLARRAPDRRGRVGAEGCRPDFFNRQASEGGRIPAWRVESASGTAILSRGDLTI